MTNILDIGRSGLMAYRNALAVTAENIANVGTDGYRRRDVSTITAGGGQSTPGTLPTGGQGVTVTDVRRAFDSLAAERARSAQAGQSAATAHLAGAQAIETLMIPGDDGIDGTLRDFFDSLSRLAGNPTDSVTRSLTLGAGQAATAAIADLAKGMAGLRNDLLKEAQGAAATAQALLQDLAEVSKRMGGLSVPGSPASAAVHPLADRRDALLDELARIMPVSVTLGDDQRPTVRFGSEAGALLLDGTRTASLTVSAPDQLTLHIDAADGVARETRLLPSGRIGGLSRAIGALDMAAGELDGFARTLTEAMNRVHRGGIDQTGARGGDLLRLDGWVARPAGSNAGTMQVSVTPTATNLPRAPIQLVFDGAAGLWRATDGAGAELATGTDKLLLPGATVDLAGRAVNGDRILLTQVEGRAIDLRLAVTDPARLAAASAFATTAAPANTGQASMTATLTALPASPLADLGTRVGPVPIDLSAGALGMIPAGTDRVTLSSLGRAATVTLPPTPGATGLDLTLDGQSHGFDVAPMADAAAMATALNDGTLLSDRGRSLATLGLVASVTAGGGLAIARPGGDTAPDATLTGPAGTVAGTPTPAEAAGGTIQIITRNGRHVAGTPLSPAEITSLMTPANGFLPGAVYDPSPLGTVDGAGYRGTMVDRTDIPGAHVATVAAGPLSTGASLPLPPGPARSLTLTDASGLVGQVDLPMGASAALAAARIADRLPGLGASASTALELTGFAAGTVAFSLTGANGVPLQVSALLSGGDAAPLAQALNALTGATGIRAELSPDGARLLLVEGSGHDITLSGLVSAQPAGLTATPAGRDGLATGPATSWQPGGAIRQSGLVEVTATQGFSVAEGLTSTAAVPVRSSALSLQPSEAGASVTLTARDVPGQAEGGLLHSLRIGGQRFDAALPPGAGAAAVAAALAASLRAGAPDAVLTSRPLTSLPPDGSSLTLRVDGANHVLRMQDGQPVVTGPEAERVTARLDAENRIVLTARGVTDGAGIDVPTSGAFGFAPGLGTLTLTGQPPRTADLPATLSVTLGGAEHVLTLGTGGALTVPPGFPGTASRDEATGALRLTVPAPGAGLRVATSAAAGFGGPGAAVQVQGAELRLTGRAGPLGVTAEVRGSPGQVITLADLPPEDLVMALTGAGTLRLAGTVTGGVGGGVGQTGPGAATLEVLDADTGRVALTDAVTGHRIAEGALDGSGRVSIAGLTMQLSGQARSGDRFGILPGAAGSANADTALALAALRNPDPVTGSPGITERFTRLQGDTGLRTAAAQRSLATATAAAEASEREQAAIGAVDLDTEAARLLELQQAYQASAQATTVARDLFDTLLRMF